MLLMKKKNENKRKEKTIEEIERPKQERVRTLGEKENYKYLEILEEVWCGLVLWLIKHCRLLMPNPF